MVKTLKKWNKKDEKILEKSMEKFKGKIQKAMSGEQTEGKETKHTDKELKFDGKAKIRAEKIREQQNTETSGRPFCIEEKGWGFLKFGKYGKKIKIGSPASRHFRLLQCLSEPSGVARITDSVFEAIRLPKDTKDSRLADYNTTKNRKIELIQYTIKELQKNKGLKGRLKFQFSDTKREIRLEIR